MYHYQVGNDGGYQRAHSRAKNLLVTGAIVNKVMRQKDNRFVRSSADKEVLCSKEASTLSVFSVNLMARSTGILVKREITPNDTN